MSASYEDIFFYLDLTTDVLKRKDIIKGIKSYISEKNKVNVKGHYGVLIFQSEGNPIFLTDKKDAQIISKAIDENWKTRPKKESFFENGLFYIFSYIAETVRKKSKKNRVIVITDTPSDLNEEYQEALFNLVSKIKHFPTFIDIIRISEKDKRFFKDDVKLNILASDTKGGIFYIQDKKELSKVLEKLVKTKQIVSTFADRPDELKISEEDYLFYSKLAKKLIIPEVTTDLKCYLCKEQVCPVCTNIFDVPRVCDECKAAFHNCCATNYTLSHNIGIPHIFRCPKCDVLLQISEEEIVDTSSMNIEEEPEIIETSSTEIEPEILSASEKVTSKFDREELTPIPQPKSLEPISEKEQGEVKKVRLGGFFGKVYVARKTGGKIVYSRASSSNENVDEETSNRYNSVNEIKESELQVPKIEICPICGTAVNSKKQEICHNCGSKL